jgi:F-type H+-transporting ATPase subunit b
MELMAHQLGIFLLAADRSASAGEPSIVEIVEKFLIGSIPTLLLFIVLVLCYQFLVQGPLSRALRERYARTEGAVEEAHKAIGRAEARAQEYATRLRQARAEIFAVREQRIRQWPVEEKVSQAKAELEAEAAAARKSIQASAGDLASRVVRAVLPAAAGGTR